MKKKNIGIITIIIIILSILLTTGFLFIFLKDSKTNEGTISNNNEGDTNMPIYSYQKQNDVADDYYPINTHLCVEHEPSEGVFYVYFVPFQNTKTIRKYDCSDGSSSVITTETDEITKFYHDRSGSKLYFIHGLNKLAYVDLSDDSVSADYTTTTDAGGTLGGIEDIAIYDSDIFLIDCKQDDLIFYKYDSGNTEWDDVGSVNQSDNNYFDISGDISEAYDLCWDGSYFYVIDFYIFDAHGYVMKFDSDFTLQTTYDIGTGTLGINFPTCICWDGTNFFIGYGTNIYKLPTDFSSILETYDLSGDLENKANGIEWDGNYFYIAQYRDDIEAKYAYVHKYNSSFTHQTTYDLGDLGGNEHPRGLCWDGSYFYIIDTGDNYIYKYSSDFSTLITSYDIGVLGENDDPTGITFDDNYFFVVEYLDSYIYQYHPDLKTELGAIFNNIIISDKCYVIYQYITGDVKIYQKDLDDTTNPTLLETFTSGLKIPYLENLRGIAVANDDDTLYFVLEDTSDNNYYLCSYVISTDTFTKGAEFNVALGLNRNTNSGNDIPFNVEKGFGVGDDNNLIIYQLPSTFNGKLNKIADLTNASWITSGSIIAITDHFLFIKESDDNIIEAEFVDSDEYVLNGNVYHFERDYSEAEIFYFDDKLYWEEDIFVQIIGTKTSNGSTNSNEVIFEGYIEEIEDPEENLDVVKRAYIVSPARLDLELYFPDATVSSGDTDEHVKELQDDCEYVKEGTIADGGALNNTSYGGGNSFRILLTQFGAFDQFTWYLTPTGDLYYNDSTIDSGVNYTESNTHSIRITKREIRYNSVIVKGSRESGTQIESDEQTDDNLIAEFGKKAVEFTIPWIDLKADANTMASSLLALLKTALVLPEITVRDATSGMIQVGEEITFSHATKGISSAQYKINGVIWDYKNSIGTYFVSSGIYYDLDDLREQTQAQVEEQISQVSSRTESVAFTDEKAQDAIGTLLDDGTVGEIVFTYDDGTPLISGVVQDGEIDHNSLSNYDANEHVDYTTRMGDEGNAKLYRGTYNFDGITTTAEYYKGSWGLNYETAGNYADPTTLNCIDGATLHDGSFDIVTWQNHVNCIRLQDDATAGEDPYFYHDQSQSTAGIWETWVGTNDVTKLWDIILRETNSNIVRLRIYDSALDYLDSSDVWQEVQAVANDMWYHVKIEWYADNTFDVYVDGTLQIDGVACNTNQSSGINRVFFQGRGDSTDYFYLDAPGLVGEEDPQGYTYVEQWNALNGDIDELLDDGWNISFGALNGSYIRVQDEVLGHKDVLDLYDNQNDIDCNDFNYIRRSFDPQEYGTIEFFMGTDDASFDSRARSSSQFSLRIISDKFQYYDGSWNDVGLAASDNTLYHVRIAFECGAGGYEGLSADTWKLWIDGTEYGPYDFGSVANSISYIDFYTVGSYSGYHFYIDALGFSWDEDYNIGDNLLHGEWLVADSIKTSGDGQYSRSFIRSDDPTVNDDCDSEYKPGDFWINLTDGGLFVCVDNADGAADWDEITKA